MPSHWSSPRMTSRVSWFLDLVVVLVTMVETADKGYPIGVLLDSNDLDHKLSILNHGLEIQNNKSISNGAFKLRDFRFPVDLESSFELRRAVCGIMSRGVFSFISDAEYKVQKTLASFGYSFNMPYVNVNQGSYEDFVIHIRPRYEEAIISLIQHYKWRDIVYMYDDGQDMSRLHHILGELRHSDMYRVRVVKVHCCHAKQIHSTGYREPNYYQVLRKLEIVFSQLSQKNVIIDVSGTTILKNLLNAIENMGMNRHGYHYILATLEVEALELNRFRHGGVNITSFGVGSWWRSKRWAEYAQWCRRHKRYYSSACHNVAARMDLKSALLYDSLRLTAETLVSLTGRAPNIFRKTFRRGEVYNNNTRGLNCENAARWQHGISIVNHAKTVSFNGITGFVAFDRHGNRRKFTLEIHQLSFQVKMRQIGEWRSARRGGQAEMTLSMNGYNKMNANNVKKKNRTKIVTTIFSRPYLMLKKQPDDGSPLLTGNDRYEGYCVDLAKKISEIVKFKYVLKIVGDGKYGARSENGTWNGMVGELTAGKVDLAIAPLTISSIRERVVDFSKPYMSLGISIMIKKPDKLKPGIFSFMKPIAFEIWVYVIMAYLGVGTSLFVISRFSPYEWRVDVSSNSASGGKSAVGGTFHSGGIGNGFASSEFTIFNSFWFALSAIMRQGCDISPRSLSGRIVGAAWWFFTLILISSYTANLVAFLTVERMLTPIESADDLAKQTEIQYGTLDAGSTKNFFLTSKIEVYTRMWDFMDAARPNVFVDETKDGVERVRNSKGKYAFLLESTMNDYHNQQLPCNTMKIGGNLDSKGYGIATPLDSELREPISLAVLRLRESGYLQKLHKRWWYDKGECGRELESGSVQSALTLNNVAGIFYILIGGLGLALTFSLVEFFFKSRLEAKQAKDNFNSAIKSKSVSGSFERNQYITNAEVISLTRGKQTTETL